MKATWVIAWIVLLVMVTRPMLGQSTFALQNRVSGLGINAPVFDAEGNRLAGTVYAVELWGGATITSLSPTLDFTSSQRVILPFLTGANAGYFTSTKEMAVWEVSPGSYAWVQVRAWDTRLGATYEEVAARGLGGYGESGPLYLLGGNPGGLVPPSPLTGLESFSLRAVVPEPGTALLLLLGVPWVVLRWRRSGK